MSNRGAFAQRAGGVVAGTSLIHNVRFFHFAGHANARPQLDALLRSATRSFRSAVCFLTEPGSLLLRNHSDVLSRAGSFFVASVDWPTDLPSLLALHLKAPNRVYIHLGGSTPEEVRVGRALMHSKILLGEGEEFCQLWVGSHNLTGQAIEGGNIEAAIEMTAPLSSQPIQDAIAHLEVCRATAELFDPSQMPRYREIQERRRRRISRGRRLSRACGIPQGHCSSRRGNEACRKSKRISLLRLRGDLET